MKQELKERIEKIRKGKVPEGYKETKFGIIPRDWEVKTIGDLCEIKGGGTPNTNIKKFWEGDIPWISSSDLIKDNIYHIDVHRYINEDAVKKSATKIIPKNSIIVVSRVGVGKIAINYVDLCTSQDFLNLIIKNNDTNNIFLAYILKKQTQRLLSCNQGTSIKGFIKEDFKALQIPFPPKSEQEVVVDIISNIDKIIILKEKLIVEKKDFKKGLMQNLLTGGKRFPEFSDKWNHIKIKSYFEPSNEKVQKNNYTIASIGKYGIRDRADIYSKELSKDYSNNKILRKNQIAFGMGSQSIAFGINLSNNVYCVSAAYKVYNLVNINTSFFNYLFKLENKKISNQFMIISARQGKSIDFDGLLNYKLKIPSLKEQDKISEIIEKQDKEILFLKKELNNLKEQKRGLMQLLLTGIVRVKVD